MMIKRCIRYKSLTPVELNKDDNIKVIRVTDDGDIILWVNGKRITLVELERQLEINI